jgi:arginase
VPGTAKAPEALRDAGLFARFLATGATDGGVILPGRYVDDDLTREPGHVRNERAIVDHARRLADRIGDVIDSGDAPLVIGGDCSLLIAAGLALSSRGRFGLAHVDGHTDFRHPGNSDRCASVAGEDLAAAVGLHWPALSHIDGRGPYFSAAHTVHIGCRENDDHLEEVRAVLRSVISAQDVIDSGPTAAAQSAVAAIGSDQGYWLHVDVDVLDPKVMPAVDSPDPGGLDPDQFVQLLHGLAPAAIGAQITVFDPDLDPDRKFAALLVELVSSGLAELGSARSTAAGV